MRTKTILPLAAVALCAQVSASGNIYVNQLGYNAGGKKSVQVAGSPSSTFEVKDANTNKTIYKGTLSAAKHWALSGEDLKTADFSQLNTTGNYYVEVDGKKSFIFPIVAKDAYHDLSVWTLKAFYLWRASTPIESQFATFKGIDYGRKAGHPDDEVYLHMLLADENHNALEPISTPKGWYDAGDYNKYTVNAGFSNEFFGMAYEMYPEYFQKLDLNIPESGNGAPDILNELKWELDWMLTMQAPDGGVYNKTTSMVFSRFYMPHRDLNDRYVVGKSTTSALNFASSMAMAARLYAPYQNQFPGFSEQALAAAKKAYEWAKKHPDVAFENPGNVHTGSYSDKRLTDEVQMAAAELLITTKDKKYAKDITLNWNYDTPVWHDQESMQLMLLALHSKEIAGLGIDTALVNAKFKKLADKLVKQAEEGCGLAAKEMKWGSNGYVATNGTIAGLAYRKWKDEKYKQVAIGCFDYLMGKNPTNYCYVTGFGTKYPMNIHDRRSFSDGIVEPIPGYLCGGPNNNQQRDCGEDNYPSKKYPAKSYLDAMCSYSTNEIAINWNAPLVLLNAMMANE